MYSVVKAILLHIFPKFINLFIIYKIHIKNFKFIDKSYDYIFYHKKNF
jgi:hypothetical protein